MYPGDFSTEQWLQLMWSCVWIFVLPIAVALLLLTITILTEVVSRAAEQPQRSRDLTLR